MSSLLTNSAMLAVMLLHAGFGCCWHHDHAAHAGDEFVASSSKTSGCGHHHHPERSSREDGDPQAPCSDPVECHDDCVFVTSGSPTVPGLDLAWLGLDVLEYDEARCILRARVVADWNWSRVPPGDASPRALRPLLCVWQV